ncbi:membrane-associated phospholipid phosphatase [Paraburkholderia sp. WSM4179]|uniref:phosphatase PAP2 family protein n=1 Tax=Paraburkholderia sp. WSM4179 TaxID=2991073 RepID=UPI0003A06CB0|nr:phosphatase PAP2 family protein [Paraburkholderia sp. WSM4179]MDH6153581.1 membrane-associated phospholipid phosphatase [Paraburkholderia sp. WSM4179]
MALPEPIPGYSVPGDRVANLSRKPAQGMVSMPSFHTTLAIVFIYALRRAPQLLLFAIPLNVTMILATPTQGGHYLADAFAGLLLSALTIAALKRCMHLLATRKSANAPSSRSMPMRTA